MIHLSKGNDAEIIVTLTEKLSAEKYLWAQANDVLDGIVVTEDLPNYIFNFKNRVTNEEVNIFFLESDDVSSFKDRFNQFDIAVDDYFLDSEAGQWTYIVYEAATEADDISTLNVLETGIMWLEDGAQHQFTQRSTNNEYKTR